MLRNYFLIALRNLRKNKVFSLINILGLAVGLCCCLLIAAYIRDETSYDKYPAEADNIYRVNLGVIGNSLASYPSVDIGVGPGMKAAYPEIKAYTRLERLGGIFGQYGVKQFKEDQLAFADSNFFGIFTLPFLDGDAHTALNRPNSVVVTKAFAEKYFGSEPAVGKALTIGDYGVCRVTGVIDKIPDNASFHFDAFLSMSTLHFKEQSWSNVGMYTWLVLDPKADAKKLEARFPQLVAKYAVPEIARDMGVPLDEAKKAVNTFIFSLIRLRDVHLHSNTKYELEAGGDIHYVYIFGALALFILLLACANFTNLSTASSAGRSKEVGVRKVMGSLKGQLVAQFLTESVLLTLCAMLLAYGLAGAALSFFNQVAGKHISFTFFLQPVALLTTLVVTIVVGIIAGLYPAVFLSSYNTIKVLKGSATAGGGRKSLLRSGLVVFQFFVSIGLIVATLVVYRQLHFMQDRRLGYDKDQVVYLQDTRLLGQNQEAFRSQLLQDRRVVDATISWCVPGSGNMNGTEIYPKKDALGGAGSTSGTDGHDGAGGSGNAGGADANGKEIHSNIYNVDYDYVPTLGLKIVQGRNFTRGFPTDSTGVIINQAAVSDLGWDHTNPIGRTIVRSGRKEYKVIGVVADFHYLSVKEKIAPLMLLMGNNYGGMLVKVNTADIRGFIEDVKKKWEAFSPAGPFGYYFLDEKFEKLYTTERRTGRLFTAFTLIAILIAGLGLFGLAAYIVEQRTREIGIRKVLGASVSSLLLLVSREFLLLVGLAFLIAVPVTWWGMHQWLQDFAYRAPISWWIFPVAGAAALAIAIATISFQAVKAAISNPMKSLRTE
ncbi:MAG TPA: ABC transporter permease [Puia sp.]|jgi:putative ABC transport system permease protein